MTRYQAVKLWLKDVAQDTLQESYEHAGNFSKHHFSISGHITHDELEDICDKTYAIAHKKGDFFVGHSMGEFIPAKLGSDKH